MADRGDGVPPVPRSSDDPAGTRLRLLYELGCAFASRIDLDELSALVVAKCRDAFDAEGVSILLLDAERNELYFPYVAGEDPEVSRRLLSLRFPADRGISGAVLQSGRSLRVDDAATDPRFYGAIDRQTGLTTRNLICAPLTSRHGAIGVVQVINRCNGGRFTDDDLAFLDALAGSVAIAIENARFYAQLKQQVAALEAAVQVHNELLALHRELDIASRIQQSILPRTFPPFPERTDLEIFAAMLPAKEIGGDFYDFFLIDEDRLGFLIGDVSGKGVPAALFMAVSRTLLKSIALEGTPPGECLRRVNGLLIPENSAELFVTVFYAILNTATGEIEYASGGHNPPVLLGHDGRVTPLEGTGGVVLGVLEDLDYAAKRLTMQPGDGIFLYTDGVTEAMDADGTLFSDGRLLSALAQDAGAAPEALIHHVVDSVKRHSGAAPQTDDIAALAIRYHGRGPDAPTATMIASNDLADLQGVSRFIERFGATHGLPSKVVFELCLAVDEVLTNIISYAYEDRSPQPIGVHISLMSSGAERAVRVQIEDTGRPFDPLAVPTPSVDTPLEQRAVGGLGMHMVRRVTNDLSYERTATKNVLTILKRLGERSAD